MKYSFDVHKISVITDPAYTLLTFRPKSHI